MSVNINASTTNGLVLTSDTSGEIKLQSAGADIVSVTANGLDIGSGNLNFSSTAQRITGDFSNATFSNRVAFQSSTTNGNSFVGVLPNGTSTDAGLNVYSNSDPTNSSVLLLNASSTSTRIDSSRRGTGTYLPMTFFTNGTERMRIDSSGNLLFNSGYGSVATAYGCRAWVNFRGNSTVLIRASGNVSSITDHGTGDYSINFTTSMPNVNYCANVTIPAENHYCTGIGTGGGVGSPTSSYGTSAFRTGIIRSQGGAVFDPAYINIAIFR